MLESVATQAVRERFSPQWLIVDADMQVHAHSEGAEPFLTQPMMTPDAQHASPVPTVAVAVKQQWDQADEIASDEPPVSAPLLVKTLVEEERQVLLSVSQLEDHDEPDLRLVVVHEYQADSSSAQTPLIRTAKEKLMADKLRQIDVELISTKAQVQKSLDFTRRVLDSLYVFVGVCDLEGNLIEANQAAIRAANLQPEDVLNKPFIDAYWWSHSKESQHKLQGAIDAARRGESSRFDVQICLVDNQNATIDFQMVPMLDDRGNITHLVPSAIDVTDRRQIERALEYSEASARTLLSEIEEIYATAPIGLCVLDKELRYVRINEHLAQINGLSVADHIGQSVLDVVPDVARNAVESLRQIFETGEPLLGIALSGETLYEPGIMRHWVESFHPVRSKDGEIDRISIVAEEVTHRVQHEAHVEKMRIKAERANRSKSEFLANMSHEIRTPMTAILGFADLLSTQVSDSQSLQSIETIRRNGLYLIELLDDILDLSRIEANKFDLELAAISPVSIMEQIGELMQVRADQQAVSLSIEYVGDVPVTIKNDPTRLRQILVNIVGNAIKFTGKGCVTLSLSYLDESEPGVQFTVTDTGIGMSQEQLTHIFEAFAQADSTISRRYGGSGLGLAICNRLVKRLGGHLSIESEPGVGTTVQVRFPVGLDGPVVLEPPNVNLPASMSTAAVDTSINLPFRILAVDDKHDVLMVVRRILEKAGADVSYAESGQKAMDLFDSTRLSSRPFDAVILDMHMPEVDGFEVVKRLRERGEILPVIALTADAMKGGREKCLQAGCTDYITKPIDRQLLLKTVHKHLAGHNAGNGETGVSHTDSSPRRVSSNSSRSSPVILLVEDHEPSARVLTKLLSRHGYTVHSAGSAEHARQHIAQVTPDVILCDIGLPGEDGYELVKALREQPDLSGCSFVSLSGSSVSDHIKAYLFDASIKKPVDMKALLDVLSRLGQPSCGNSASDMIS
ncbi:MAG: response regulator [Granulosicoccus sp.]